MNILELLFSNKKKELKQTCEASIEYLDYLKKKMERHNKMISEWIKENPGKPIPPHLMILI